MHNYRKMPSCKFVIVRILPAIILLIFNCQNTIAQSKSTLKIWYQEPATYWEASLPLGNGRLGAMPDGGVFKENIVLNDITLWSGGKQNADKADAYKSLPQIRQLLAEGKNAEAEQMMNKYFVCEGKGSGNAEGANLPYGCYQALGNLAIHYTYGADSANLHPTNYKRELSLDNALASTGFSINNTVYKREYFTSFDDDVIVLKLSANELKKINFNVSLSRLERFNVKTVGNELQMTGRLNNGTDGKGMQYMVRLRIKQEGGKITNKGDSLQLENANTAEIYISAGTDYKTPNYVNGTRDILASALKKSYIQQKTNHIKNFQKLFHRATLQLDDVVAKDDLPTDERLEAYINNPNDNGLAALYFQYGRYLLIGSTRPGLLPPNLQGLWANNINTPWNGDYHLDINIQMNHWPLEVTNLGALNEPFFKLVQSLVKPGEKTAKAYYNSEGWIAFAITNIWGYTSPGEDSSWGAYNTGSAWLCQMLWSHYEFTHDKAYLSQIYPILKGSAQFYLSTLIKGPSHGWLITSPSNSPENHFIQNNGEQSSVCEGPTIDNQILRSLFSVTITASQILNVDPGFKQKLRIAKSQLPPDQIGKDGRLMEWLQEYKEVEIHHRHIAPLYGLYPGTEISVNKPELVNAAKALLKTRGDNGTGWSLAWKMNCWARLHDGNHAFKLFHRLLQPVKDKNGNGGNAGGSYINLFCAHSPFQIDGNFGGTAGIAEMLLQSQESYIELLPALPDQWKDGSFSGWRVRGGGEISASWKNAKLNDMSIKATVNNKFKIKLPPNVTGYKITRNGKSLTGKLMGHFFSIKLSKGETAEIHFT